MDNDLIRIGFFAPATVYSYHTKSDLSLPKVEDCIDESWDEDEKNIVLTHLQVAPIVASYLGFSTCRVCSCVNGSQDQSDDVFVWPTGYAHYVEKHGVRPPQNFIDHCLAKYKKK